ncbi:MAG: hypothetical protein GF333_01665 [Candidatus Omnitrophica bacterium]|nr:hypothetical protein [Candidatus Omnitrophota bacterium]
MSDVQREYRLKRPVDFFLGVLAVFLSLPLWGLCAYAVLAEDGRPVFYGQYRIGRAGRRFRVFKFRSMIKNAEALTGPVFAQENDSRLTKTGQVMRATALDELPQILSILKGDMSFVGPRPERPEFVATFAAEVRNYMMRHAVRPGLTGVAQIFGQYDTPPRHKLRYDLFYIRRQSLLFDLVLITISLYLSICGKWRFRRRKFPRRYR